MGFLALKEQSPSTQTLGSGTDVTELQSDVDALVSVGTASWGGIVLPVYVQMFVHDADVFKI